MTFVERRISQIGGSCFSIFLGPQCAKVGDMSVAPLLEDENISQLIWACRSTDQRIQRKALANIKKNRIITLEPHVWPLLDSSDASMVILAAQTLCELGVSHRLRLANKLLTYVNHKEWTIRSAVVEILGELINQEFVPKLGHLLLSDPEVIIRASAAEALGESLNISAQDYLLEALTDQNSLVRRHAADALGLIGNVETQQLWNAFHQEQDIVTKVHYLCAIYRIDSTQTIEKLIELMLVTSLDIALDILSLLDDMVFRQTPRCFLTQKPTLVKALHCMRAEHPELSSQVEVLTKNLLAQEVNLKAIE